MEDCHSVKLSFHPSINHYAPNFKQIMDDITFNQHLVGSLLYLTATTRLDSS